MTEEEKEMEEKRENVERELGVGVDDLDDDEVTELEESL